MKLLPIIEIQQWSMADVDLVDCDGVGIHISWLGFVFQCAIGRRPKGREEVSLSRR